VQDELWKENLADVIQRINIIKPAMATGAGSNIIGLMIGISTVGEFDGGGQRFQHFANGSHWEMRDENGQTATGMMNLFFPAYYCLEGYVDMYGDPVIDDPPKEVRGVDGRIITIGAKTFIKNRIDELTRQKDWRARNKFILDHPSEWRDLFRKNVNDSSYNVDEMQERITELKNYRGVNHKSTRYRLEWENGEKYSKSVVAVPDPAGKHIASYLPLKSKQNRVQYDALYECNFPHPDVIGKMYGGFDPFALNANEKSGKSGRGSDAGFAIYYREDLIYEGDKERGEWDSDNFTWAYKDRPPILEDSFEEVLKALIFNGALCCVENNHPDFDRWMKKIGFAGYLLHRRNPETMKIEDLSGIKTIGSVGESLFMHFGNYLARNTQRCNIVEILEDALHVGHYKYMTDHDLFTGACIAYYAATHLDEFGQRYDLAGNGGGDLSWIEEF
jgi:hypothetical protein